MLSTCFHLTMMWRWWRCEKRIIFKLMLINWLDAIYWVDQKKWAWEKVLRNNWIEKMYSWNEPCDFIFFLSSKRSAYLNSLAEGYNFEWKVRPTKWIIQIREGMVFIYFKFQWLYYKKILLIDVIIWCEKKQLQMEIRVQLRGTLNPFFLSTL